ncbi:hypothetical protein PLICRDRAFT_179210 [Plicaturopsis crispa FD-325 SS-3]|uniref:F-box domain-containing protein n=1 Tax=Plicaturopsis crispa FD-325 SS-3 TaxID=944288 RepID=A0A0C9SRP3_PLICR|nr:hypothetical protein PLICRDRAFT_179210 [Plicaturopsis crispa FD-325 SS-3]
MDGLTDAGPSCNLSYVDRLALLHDHRAAWGMLHWKDKKTIPFHGSCQAYELVGGVFAKTMSSMHFDATVLPTSLDPDYHMISMNLKLPVRDFVIDPTQDLLVLVEAGIVGRPSSDMRIHLRDMSNNTTHPEASQPTLVIPNIQSSASNSFISVVDDVVGVYAYELGPRLIIWNWKTGVTLVDCSSDMLPPQTWDFTFLSARAFMVTSVNIPGRMHVFSFTSTPGKPKCCAVLHLPPLQQDVELDYLATHTAPFHAYCPRGVPFTTSRESRIHVLSMQYVSREGTHPRFILFLHNRTLLRYVDSPLCEEEVDIPWDAWGPRQSRFLTQHAPFEWLRYAHGQRVICPPTRLTENRGTLVQLLDFNVHPEWPDTFERVAAEAALDKGLRYRLVLEESIIYKEQIFVDDFSTSLPYRVLGRMVKSHYSGFMIDEQRILGLNSTAFSEADMKEIDVFMF